MNKKIFHIILSMIVLVLMASFSSCTNEGNLSIKEEIARIEFVSNGGSKVEAINKKAGEKIEAPTDPIREGYIFAGWYESKDNGATLNENPFVFSYMPAKSLTLYVKWKLKSVPNNSYKQNKTCFNWKSEEEKALYLENSPSTEEQWITYFSNFNVKITFDNKERVIVSFRNNKNETSTYALFYAIGNDNVIRFYENEATKVADRKYTGVGLLLHTFKIADDCSNVTIIVDMVAYTKEDTKITVELDMICPISGN